jgi:hypothetical protein
MGFQGWSGGFGEEKTDLFLTDNETRLLGSPSHSLVTIMTTLTAKQVTAN